MIDHFQMDLNNHIIQSLHIEDEEMTLFFCYSSKILWLMSGRSPSVHASKSPSKDFLPPHIITANTGPTACHNENQIHEIVVVQNERGLFRCYNP